MTDHNRKTITRNKEKAGKDILCHLKWFNAAKGFGFVVPEGQNHDVFLHASTLQKQNYPLIGKGATLACDIEKGDNGYSVSHISEIIDAGDSPLIKEISNNNKTSSAQGVVKWYDEEKEFGFIAPTDGVKDIFIHKTCLKDSSLETLMTGQSVLVNYKTILKGREATSIEIIT